MSNVSLFVVGTLVTLLVTASMALLIWGAVLDGRDQREHERDELEAAEPARDDRLRIVDDAA